jgi:protein-S-isoprenylcysteine O-methyltransferase Ste14
MNHITELNFERPSADLLQRAARSRKRSRRVETFTELAATVALVVSIAAILTVFTWQSAGAAPLDGLTLSESERIGVVVALAFIMAAMGGLTAAMIRRTVGATRDRKRR